MPGSNDAGNPVYRAVESQVRGLDEGMRSIDSRLRELETFIRGEVRSDLKGAIKELAEVNSTNTKIQQLFLGDGDRPGIVGKIAMQERAIDELRKVDQELAQEMRDSHEELTLSIETSNKNLGTKVDNLVEKHQEFTDWRSRWMGGWTALIFVFGAAGGILSFAMSVVSFLAKKG